MAIYPVTTQHGVPLLPQNSLNKDFERKHLLLFCAQINFVLFFALKGGLHSFSFFCDIFMFRASDRGLGSDGKCRVHLFPSPVVFLYAYVTVKMHCYLTGVAHTSLLSTFHT